jgi:hypothetical protein
VWGSEFTTKAATIQGVGAQPFALVFGPVFPARTVDVGSRVLRVLGRGGDEGRVPRLMTAAVESEASESGLV